MAITEDVAQWLKQDYPELIFMLLPNLLLFIAVFFQGLDAGWVLLVYWAESAVVGIYNILKIGMAGNDLKAGVPRPARRIINVFFKTYVLLFFVVHYGIFMAVHLLFLTGILGVRVSSLTLATLAVPLLCVLALFIAHGFDFVKKYVTLQAYKTQRSSDLFWQPYKRIVVMHLIILFGFLILRWIGTAMMMAWLLITLKSIVDVVLAWRRRAATGS